MSYSAFAEDVFKLGAEPAAIIAHQSGVKPQVIALWLTRLMPNK